MSFYSKIVFALSMALKRFAPCLKRISHAMKLSQSELVLGEGSSKNYEIGHFMSNIDSAVQIAWKINRNK